MKIGNVLRIGVVLFLIAIHVHACGSDDAVDVEEWYGEVQGRVERCAELLIPMDQRKWDEELEIYLPTNWRWRECMGVGR